MITPLPKSVSKLEMKSNRFEPTWGLNCTVPSYASTSANTSVARCASFSIPRGSVAFSPPFWTWRRPGPFRPSWCSRWGHGNDLEKHGSMCNNLAWQWGETMLPTLGQSSRGLILFPWRKGNFWLVTCGNEALTEPTLETHHGEVAERSKARAC